MSHIGRQIASKGIDPDHKRSIVFKYVYNRVRSAARRAQRLRVLPPVGVALMAAESAMAVMVIKKSISNNENTTTHPLADVRV